MMTLWPRELKTKSVWWLMTTLGSEKPEYGDGGLKSARTP
jgi:hypothetical protein